LASISNYRLGITKENYKIFEKAAIIIQIQIRLLLEDLVPPIPQMVQAQLSMMYRNHIEAL
jgi:hypothetical protein